MKMEAEISICGLECKNRGDVGGDWRGLLIKWANKMIG